MPSRKDNPFQQGVIRPNLDAFVKSRKYPLSLDGRALGEGDKAGIPTSYVPLLFIPSHQGRGSTTFCETINLEY